MTEHHTHFNETTQKWEKPELLHKVRAHHEEHRDFDVQAGRWLFENARFQRRYMKFLENESGEAFTRYRDKAREYDVLQADHLSFVWESVLTDAFVDSLHEVYQPEDDPAELATRALNNAKMIVEELKGTPGPLIRGIIKPDFIDKVVERLEEDGALTKTSTARHYPRGVMLVKTLSTGDDVNALEQTIATFVTGVITSLQS